ncbi:hypothetical protein ACKWTF_015551 [Chironomus riparius]
MWRFFLILSISLSITHAEESVNPCDSLTANQTFAINPRGCDMYYYCGDNNIPKPGRCPTEPVVHHFDINNQSCELPEDVVCTIDDELWNTKCPGIGIAKIPHEYSCSEYSVCLDDQPVDRTCPAGLHFSPHDQECLHPEIANCKTDELVCKGSDPFVPNYIPNSRNCRAFYICFNNILHPVSCGPNQVYDKDNNQCVPSGVVDCVQTLNPDLEVPDSLTYDCSNVKNGSRLPHPEHCKFWFWCVNGRSQMFWCGKDALFDSPTRLCAEKNQTVCGNINASEGIEVHDLTDQMEFKVMPESKHVDPFSVIQPKLSVLRSIKASKEEKIKVNKATKPEKFYGLF